MVADQARLITGAEFAAIGLNADPERPFAPFVFSGLAAERASAIGRSPRAVGLLGEVVRAGHSMRVRDLREHPSFQGYPPRHPPMRNFLGTPIRYGEKTIAHLYVANKEQAEEFTEEDQCIAEMLAERAGIAIEISRLTLENMTLNENLRAALDARDNLLAVVSHDLRNPLTGIRFAADMLKRGLPDREHVDKRVNAIVRAADIMTALIDDLLDARAMETATFTVTPTPEDVHTIVHDFSSSIESVVTQKSLHVHFDVPDALPAIACERRRIMQVLSNLVGNAVKFVPPGGTICVEVKRVAQELQFAIADNGPGISEDQVPHLFERYWKGGSGGPHGTGLGLYIAKGIVDAHHGRIWVESKAGIGTTVCFTVPIAESLNAS